MFNCINTPVDAALIEFFDNSYFKIFCQLKNADEKKTISVDRIVYSSISSICTLS